MSRVTRLGRTSSLHRHGSDSYVILLWSFFSAEAGSDAGNTQNTDKGGTERGEKERGIARREALPG